MASPTSETYQELQSAYTHFNNELFAAQLPECLITLQRRKGTLGYLSHRQFVNREGAMTDEIAMNPSYFASMTIENVLSTMVHEMVHLWQCHFGKPGRGRYHNREWANKMIGIGLHPSDTGQPGGKEIGDHMSDYIVDGGLFQRSTERLITNDYQLSWLDRFPETLGVTEAGSIDESLIAMGVKEPGTTTTPSRSNRSKFQCPGCKAQAWGKPSLQLICGGCSLEMPGV